MHFTMRKRKEIISFTFIAFISALTHKKLNMINLMIRKPNCVSEVSEVSFLNALHSNTSEQHAYSPDF